jgi:hypothetical protein
MKDINDLEHFVLQPGEMLILRSRQLLSQEYMAHLQRNLKAAGLNNVLILPPMFDVMAGNIEVMGAQPAAEEPSQEEIDQLRTQVVGAYEDGRIIEFRDAANELGEWMMAHVHQSPHKFDWDRYVYRIPSRKR